MSQPQPQTVTEDKAVDFTHPAHGHVHILDAQDGRVDEFTPDLQRRTKVALVGFAQSSRQLAPYDDPEYAIWGLNQLYRFIPRATRWFEIHENWHEHVVEGTDHFGWLREAPIPTYMTECVPGIPNSVRYPLERVLALTNHQGHTVGLDYFTSTVAYMIGLALVEGYQHIDIYGVDLIAREEYRQQKPCLEYWIGVASGMGVEVGIPVQSALLKQSHRYGYEREPRSLVQLSELDRRVGELKERRHRLQIELAGVDGALKETDYWQRLAELRANGAQYNAE